MTADKNAKKTPAKRKKPINMTLSEPLIQTANAFIAKRGSGSITSLAEEALRDFFERKGIPVEPDAESVLGEIVRMKKGR